MTFKSGTYLSNHDLLQQIVSEVHRRCTQVNEDASVIGVGVDLNASSALESATTVTLAVGKTADEKELAKLVKRLEAATEAVFGRRTSVRLFREQ